MTILSNDFTIIDIEQGCEEWLDMRLSKVTASDIPCLMGESKYNTVENLYNQKMGLIPPKPITESMLRGKELEGYIRELCEEMFCIKLYPIIIISKSHDFIMSSLDGLSEDGDVMVEIKTANRKDHENLINRKIIPISYYGQLQCQLFCSGLQQMWYCSYFQYKEEEDIKMIKVMRDDDYIENMIDKAKWFYKCMLNFKLEF